MTDDATVAQVQLGCEIEFDPHGCITAAEATSSGSARSNATRARSPVDGGTIPQPCD
jgi:hypothetical protein